MWLRFESSVLMLLSRTWRCSPDLHGHPKSYNVWAKALIYPSESAYNPPTAAPVVPWRRLSQKKPRAPKSESPLQPEHRASPDLHSSDEDQVASRCLEALLSEERRIRYPGAVLGSLWTSSDNLIDWAARRHRIIHPRQTRSFIQTRSHSTP